MSKVNEKSKATLKGIRFPLELLAEIEARIKCDNAGDNFSSWVLKACKHQLTQHSQMPSPQIEEKPPRGVLTAQKKRFAGYLMKGVTQREAAMLSGYSEKSARSKGSQLAKEPCVLAYMESKK